jgi:PhzF family phenazine biosynthesis protein
MTTAEAPMQVLKIAAFSNGDTGGNPAGVALCETLPPAEEMQRIAAEVGFSETAFAARDGGKWRVRYFAPASEVDFCGHATIALGAALAAREGDGVFPLLLNGGEISVEAEAGPPIAAALQSPPTSSRPAPDALLEAALALFALTPEDLDPRIPPAVANAGVDHLVLALGDRTRLAAMAYDFESGRALMNGAGLVTISLIQAESDRLFHARNPFASGGVYEDPATGAAAAALGGYLRDLAWPHCGGIEIRQGEDMGVPSRILVGISGTAGGSVRVSGAARVM